MQITEGQLRRVIREELRLVIRESARLSDDEVEELMLLQHSKEHLGQGPVTGLEHALRSLGSRSAQYLYRGTPRPVDANPGETFTLPQYTSFSESKEVAEKFARVYGSGTVLILQPGARGFNYTGWLRKWWNNMRKTSSPEEWNDMDGDFYVSTLEGPDAEREWIFPMRSNFRVVEKVSKDGLTLCTVELLSVG